MVSGFQICLYEIPASSLIHLFAPFFPLLLIFDSISLFIFVFSFWLSAFVSTLFMSESFFPSFWCLFPELSSSFPLLSVSPFSVSASVFLNWLWFSCVCPLSRGSHIVTDLGEMRAEDIALCVVCECLFVCVFHLSNDLMILAKDVSCVKIGT